MASSKSLASAGSIVKVSTFLKSFLSSRSCRRNCFRETQQILPSLFQEIQSQIRFQAGSLSSPGHFHPLHPTPAILLPVVFYVFPQSVIRTITRSLSFAAASLFNGIYTSVIGLAVSAMKKANPSPISIWPGKSVCFLSDHRFHHTLYPAVVRL